MWKAKAHPTPAEVAHAKALLPPSVSWHVGLIQEVGHIQYRGAMHPNASGPGKHPGVEVWTDIPEDQYGAKPMAEDLGTSTPEEIELVLSTVEKVGFPRDEVYTTINIESAWKPHNWYHGVAPEKAAGGLIGFMPFVLKALGWKGTSIEFRAQSTAEQAPWVGAYFKQVAPWKYPGDTYVAVAAGAYVGKPDDTIVYKQGTPAYDLNKVWDTDKDGVITVGNLRQVLLARMKKAPTPGPGGGAPPPKDNPPVALPVYCLVLARLESVPPSGSVANISQGDRNNIAVEVVQRRLRTEGLYTGRIDGDFGPLTQKAIERFLT